MGKNIAEEQRSGFRVESESFFHVCCCRATWNSRQNFECSPGDDSPRVVRQILLKTLEGSRPSSLEQKKRRPRCCRSCTLDPVVHAEQPAEESFLHSIRLADPRVRLAGRPPSPLRSSSVPPSFTLFPVCKRDHHHLFSSPPTIPTITQGSVGPAGMPVPRTFPLLEEVAPPTTSNNGLAFHHKTLRTNRKSKEREPPHQEPRFERGGFVVTLLRLKNIGSVGTTQNIFLVFLYLSIRTRLHRPLDMLARTFAQIRNSHSKLLTRKALFQHSISDKMFYSTTSLTKVKCEFLSPHLDTITQLYERFFPDIFICLIWRNSAGGYGISYRAHSCIDLRIPESFIIGSGSHWCPWGPMGSHERKESSWDETLPTVLVDLKKGQCYDLGGTCPHEENLFPGFNILQGR